MSVAAVLCGTVAYLVLSSHAPVFLSSCGAAFVLLFFILVARLNSARQRIQELKEDVQMYRQLTHMPLKGHVPVEPLPSAPSFHVDIPDDRMDAQEWTRQKEEQETWRNPAGFRQGHMTDRPLPYPAENSYKGWYKSGKGYKRRR